MKHKSIRSISSYVIYAYTVVIYYVFIASNVRNIEGIKKIQQLFIFSSFILLFVLFLANEKKIKTWIISALVLIASFYYSLVVTDWTLPFLVLTVLSLSKNVEIKTLLKVDIITKIGVTALIIFSNRIGLIENVVTSRGGGVYRYSLGFSHPNVLGLVIFVIILELFYISKYKWVVLFAALFLNAIIYRINDSRTAFFSLFVLIGLYLLFKSKTIGKIVFDVKPVRWILCNIFAIGSLITYWGTFQYMKWSHVGQFLDTLLSGRLRNGAYHIENYGLSLLPRNPGNYIFPTDSYTNYSTLDNQYLNWLWVYGIIATLVFLIVFAILVSAIIKSRSVDLLIVILCIACYSLFESAALNPFYNFVWVVIGWHLINQRPTNKGMVS